MEYKRKCVGCGTENNAASDKCYKCNAPLGDAYDPMLIESVCVALDKSIVRVNIKDFDMPFWSMVGLMVKWSIAAIPAFIILVIVFVVIMAILSGMGIIP